MKKILTYTLTIFTVTLFFIACTDDNIVLNVPADATLNLGTEFDPMAGVTVDGAQLNDVAWLVNPAWNPNQVNHYVFTYTVEDVSEQRNVYVQVDNLLRTYQVTDRDQNGGAWGPYPVQVTKGPEFNTLRFNELYYDDIIVNATVEGPVITIPQQQFFNNQVTIEGTGEYNGETGRITSINYTIVENNQTVTGVSTFE
jgi:hypothetical protein